MYIQSVPLFVYFSLYLSRRWNKNEFTWILPWWILTEWHAVVAYILVCCEICWQRGLNTKKKKRLQICNRNTNLMAETLNKITSTIRLKKGCTRQPSIFYLSVSTVSYNEAYHLTSLVEARTPILTVLMRNTAVRSVQDSQSLFYQFLVPDFSNIMIIIIAYFTRVDPLAKLL